MWLDPDFPESLVYEPQPDGTKQLVSAMYMLPDTVTLDEVPDIGGALTQWHIHDNLCYTPTIRSPRGRRPHEPRRHVPRRWSRRRGADDPRLDRAQQCGPFAALEGVGAGRSERGEERLCDHAHGG